MKNSAPNASSYRWLKMDHPDLDFWGIKPPLPWPKDVPKPGKEAGRFPFEHLVEGLRLMRVHGAGWTPEWAGIEKFIADGGPIGDALERADFPTALRLLDDLETLRPGTAYCAFNRGFLLRAQGDLPAALAAYVAATERAPKLEHLWMARGRTHEELEQPEDAVKCYRRALGLLAGHMQALEGLARLGAMTAMTFHNVDGTHRTQYFKPEEFGRYLAENLAHIAPDDDQLRDLLDQFRRKGDGANALMVVDRILSSQPTDAPLLRAYRAEALRRMKCLDEAEHLLAGLLACDPDLAEAHYVNAWCRFDRTDNPGGYRQLHRALQSDPNHLQALQVFFNITPQTSVEGVATLTEWAAKNGSWRAFWLASIHTGSVLGDRDAALRQAQEAYRIAPGERDAVFVYANCLNNMQEGEHTAALLHPRLPEARGDYELKYIFAGAMHRLGLRDEAVRVLRESLDEENRMTVEFRQHVQHFLDELTGLVAQGEIEPEFQPNTDALRRAVWLGDDEGPKTPFLSDGIAVPTQRMVNMSPAPGFTGTTGSICVYMRGNNAELEPLNLGWFRAHEVEFGAAEPPQMTIHLTAKRKLEATARQGERRLPVTWSLYRVPSMETEGK